MFYSSFVRILPKAKGRKFIKILFKRKPTGFPVLYGNELGVDDEFPQYELKNKKNCSLICPFGGSSLCGDFFCRMELQD